MKDTKTTLLQLIAAELKHSACLAYGEPPTVKITAKRLREYADALEQIAKGLPPCDAETS